jgi:hypothetical protein
MIRPAAIYLITQTNAKHGVHETVTDAERKVLCNVKSVTRSEYYYALNAGHKPEYIFEIAVADEYHGELFLKYRDLKYKIVRAYETEEGSIELTAERSDVNGEEQDEDEPDAGDADTDAG